LPNLDGLQATRQILAGHPEVKVLILTSVEATGSIRGALEAGASGYMLKDSEPAAVISGILAVAAGEQVFSEPISSRALNPEQLQEGLTRREIQILRMAITGMGNKQIADKLRIRPETVGNHLSKIYRKLGITHRSQAVLYALRKGLIEV
jgi:DNA-binding NarL/FixJ family response regulator